MKALQISLKLFLGSFTVVVSLAAGSSTMAQVNVDCLPMLDDDQAWSRLPPLERGQRQPLPVWARMLADSLPRTTAAMLELDALHRAHSPLGATLSAKVRTTVAEANHCAYSIACAQADLRRVAATSAGVASPPGSFTETADEEHFVLAFSRRLTLDADTITDKEVARLTDVLGAQNLVALVLLIAHANFQDRLFLVLESAANLGEPPRPLEGRFAQVGKGAGIAVPERIMPGPAPARAVPEEVDDPEWRSLDFAALQRNLDTQRMREGRIRVPPWDEVVETIPEEQRPQHPVRILWTLVCRGYQPELAAGWSACTRTFAEEAKQDRVFEESIFWIVTRTIHCFY